MGICYRATRHWRSHQKIVSCLRNSSSCPPFLSLSLWTSITPSFFFSSSYRKFWFPTAVVKTSFHNIRSSIISLKERTQKARQSVVHEAGIKREEEISLPPQWKNLTNNFRKGFSCNFASSRCILNQPSFSSFFLLAVFYPSSRWLLLASCISVTETNINGKWF